MVVTLSGNNAYQLSRRLKELSDEFIQTYGDMAVQRLDASETELQKILEAVSNLPFLVERKMVIAKGISISPTASEAIEQIIDSTDEQIDLIIVEPVLDKRGTLYKSLQKLTKYEDFSDSDAKDLPKWVVGEVTKQGGIISPSDAFYLVDQLGPNQQLLSSEIAKLCTYESKVSREQIDLLVEPTPQSKVFDILDAAFSGKKELALKHYENERAQRVEPQMILAMIAWQLRALTIAKLASGSSKAASDFGLNPYVLSKSSRLVSQVSLDRLKQLVEEALSIDYRSKTISLDLDEALKSYLVTITS